MDAPAADAWGAPQWRCGPRSRPRSCVLARIALGKLVGDPYWIHGPLIVGPMAVAKRFAKDFAQVSKALTKYVRRGDNDFNRPEVMKMFGHEVLLLPDGISMEWLAVGGGGVLHQPHRKKKLMRMTTSAPAR